MYRYLPYIVTVTVKGRYCKTTGLILLDSLLQEVVDSSAPPRVGLCSRKVKWRE